MTKATPLDKTPTDEEVQATAQPADTMPATPIHRVIRELEEGVNALGSFAVSALQPKINELKNLI